MWYAVLLSTLKKMLLALFGEKLVAYVAFSALEWAADQTKNTEVDDKIVKEWKDVYYGNTTQASEAK